MLKGAPIYPSMGAGIKHLAHTRTEMDDTKKQNCILKVNNSGEAVKVLVVVVVVVIVRSTVSW